ncbi:hypothetical protein ABIF81_005042 [Bradyrhizobium daqingense]
MIFTQTVLALVLLGQASAALALPYLVMHGLVAAPRD